MIALLSTFLASCASTGKQTGKQGQTTWSRLAPSQPAAPPAASTGDAVSPLASSGTSADAASSKDKAAKSEASADTTMLPKVVGEIQAGLMGHTAKTQPTPPPEKDKQRIVLNFDKADLAEVTNQIFAEFLKLNYVLDPKAQGRISMYVEGDFDQNELLRMVTRVYEANDISIVPKKDMYYIQPLQRSSSSGLPIADSLSLKGGDVEGKPLIVIYRLRYLDAKQAMNTVKVFLTPGRPLTSDNLTNTLIFVENADNAQTIVEMIRALDINILKEVSMEIIPVTSISPQDAVQGIESLMNKLGVLKDSAIKNNLAFIPLFSYGGVLVLSHDPDLIKTARNWLNALDVHTKEAGEQIYVYFVQNGLAKDIGDILNQVYGLKSGTSGRPDQQIVSSTTRGSGSKSGAFGRGTFGSSSSGSSSGSGSSSFGGSSSGFLSGSSSSSRSGTTGTSGTGTTSGGSQSSFRSGAAQRRDSLSGRGGTGPGNMLSGEVVIIPDEVNNAIVVRANSTDYSKVKKTIETLDILPRAVLIEVMIAEITLTNDLSYGVQWFFKNIGNVTGVRVQPTTSSDGSSDTSTISLAPIATNGMSLFWATTKGDIAALVTLLASKTEVNVLSTPTLLATDNKEASITVGGREPVPTGSAISTTDAVVSAISYEETGIILNVTPHINAGGLVRLEVEQTIRRTGATVEVGSSGNTAPTFTERNVKTTLLAQNGSTVVIGGIIENSENNSKTGVPFLQDIPLLSPLFANKSKSLDRTELIIAITPRVVDYKGSDATREFMDKLKRLRTTVDKY